VEIASESTPNAVPRANEYGKISSDWLDLSSILSHYALLSGNNIFTGYNTFRTINITPQTTSETPFSIKSLQSYSSFGPELVLNGTFETDQYWIWGIGWEWDSAYHVAKCKRGGGEQLSQNISVEAGKKYLITFTIIGGNSGSISVKLGEVSAYGPGGAIYFSERKTHQAFVVPSVSGSVILSFEATLDFDGSIDDVSVREILDTQPHIVSIDMLGATSMEIRSDSTSGSIGIGVDALKLLLSTQQRNLAIGHYALSNNTLGYDNLAIGYNALTSNITGYGNLAIGSNALSSNQHANFNTAVGHYALASNTGGYNNVALGAYALNSNIAGYENIAIGQNALSANVSGSRNIAIGGYALGTNLNSSNNVAIGYYAGRQTQLGYDVTNVSRCIFIGSWTKPYSDNDTEEVVIGYGATGSGSRSVTLGSTNNQRVIVNGKLSIRQSGGYGSINPHSYLQSSGSVALPIIRITGSNFTLDDTHYTVLVDAYYENVTIKLPDANDVDGRIYVIKKIDNSSNLVVIKVQSGQTIDGQNYISLSKQYETITIQAFDGNWYIISYFKVTAQ
jgi:hypothetical protein